MSSGLIYQKVFDRYAFYVTGVTLYHRTDMNALTTDKGILSQLLSPSYGGDRRIKLRLTNCKYVKGDPQDGEYGKRYLKDFYTNLQVGLNEDTIEWNTDNFRNNLYEICFCQEDSNGSLNEYGPIVLGFNAEILAKRLRFGRCIYEPLPDEELVYKSPSNLLNNPSVLSDAEEEVNNFPKRLLVFCKAPQFVEEKEIRGYAYFKHMFVYEYIDFPETCLVSIRASADFKDIEQLKRVLYRAKLIDKFQVG